MQGSLLSRVTNASKVQVRWRSMYLAPVQRRRFLVAVLVVASILAQRLVAQDTASVSPGVLRTRSGVLLTLSGLLQSDVRFIAHAGAASGPIIRRAELIFDAVAPAGFSLRLQPDFGQGRVLVQDAFVRWMRNGGSVLEARAGRFRPAFGAERMRSSSTLLFPERGLVNSYMPSRATGADLRLMTGRAAFQVGVFQPSVSASVQPVDTDGDLERTPPPRQEGLFRFEWRLREFARGGSVRLHMGTLAGTASGRGEAATQPSRILTVGQRPIFAFQSSGPDAVIAAGDRWRADVGLQAVGARVAWHVELLEVEDGIRRFGTERAAIKHRGVGAAWSIVRGGQRAANYAITPTSARGAVEWGVRVGAVQVEKRAVALFAEPGSATGAFAAGLAVSWLPSSLTRLAVSYDFTRLDRVRERTEHAVIVRAQQAF